MLIKNSVERILKNCLANRYWAPGTLILIWQLHATLGVVSNKRNKRIMSDGQDRTNQLREKLSIVNSIQCIILFSDCYVFLRSCIHWLYFAYKSKFKENSISLLILYLHNMIIMSEGQSCRKDKCRFSTSLAKSF